MRTTHTVSGSDAAIATIVATAPAVPDSVNEKPDSATDVHRLRFAATWHRRATANDSYGGASSSDPALRPAYPAPAAAPDAPPADALHATVDSLTDTGDGETLILRDAAGRRLHFFREGLFRWSTRTAAEVVAAADVAPGPAPRRLWVRHPGNGTWWTDTAVCHFID